MVSLNMRHVRIWICLQAITTVGTAAAQPSATPYDLSNDVRERIVDLFRMGIPPEIIDVTLELPENTTRSTLDARKDSGDFRIASENENFRVELADEVPCASCSQRLLRRYSVRNKASGEEKILETTNELAETVYDLAVWDKKLITLGRRGENEIYVISVHNLEDSSLGDQFWAYRFSISPSKRVAAFVQYYGRHSGRQSEVVVVYDFNQGPCDNRLPRYCADQTLLGIPVFPRTNLESRSYVDIVENPIHVLSMLIWCGSDTQLAFIFKDNFGNYLASVDFSEGRERPEIRTQEIPLEAWMRDDLPEVRRAEIREKASEQKHYPLSVEDMVFLGNRRLSIVPSRHYRWASRQVELPIP